MPSDERLVWICPVCGHIKERKPEHLHVYCDRAIEHADFWEQGQKWPTGTTKERRMAARPVSMAPAVAKVKEVKGDQA